MLDSGEVHAYYGGVRSDEPHGDTSFEEMLHRMRVRGERAHFTGEVAHGPTKKGILSALGESPMYFAVLTLGATSDARIKRQLG